MKTILTAALATSIASAALAQTTTPPTATTPPAQTKPMTPSGATAPAAGAEKPVGAAGATASAPAASSMADGMKMADTATVAVKFISVAPADFMSSRLVGASVYNNQNETVGEVADLVIENGKMLKGVVVSVGGFLGMGESYVVLDPSTMVLNQRDGTWRVYVNTSKDNLKNAPKFTYSKMKK